MNLLSSLIQKTARHWVSDCCIYSEFCLRQPANKNTEDIKTIKNKPHCISLTEQSSFFLSISKNLLHLWRFLSSSLACTLGARKMRIEADLGVWRIVTASFSGSSLLLQEKQQEHLLQPYLGSIALFMTRNMSPLKMLTRGRGGKSEPKLPWISGGRGIQTGFHSKCVFPLPAFRVVFGTCVAVSRRCLTLSCCHGSGVNFSCVSWRGLSYSDCLAPSIVNWDGDAAKGWVTHPY